MISGFLKFLGVKSYIKIPNKQFSELSNIELASMIDAHLNEGNSDFEEDALTEFTLMRYKSTRLEDFKEKINNIHDMYQTDEYPDGWLSSNGMRELLLLSDKLKGGK